MTRKEWRAEGESKEEWIKKKRKRNKSEGRRISVKAVRAEK